jgi:hypothetical protein
VKVKAPSKPLPAGYRPSGSVPYRVGDRDSWASIAVAHGVDPWWLIQYNFETRNPAEVNWYLQNRVGCKKTTTDGANLRFSAADSPGLIHVPTPQTARAVQSLKYAKFGIVIEGDDDYRKQVETTLDWIARSDTGQVLLNALERKAKTIRISPWTGTVCNATAASTDVREATAAGQVVLRGGASFEQMSEPSMIRDLLDLPHEPMIGTGRGSDARVRFSPSMFGFGNTGSCASTAGTPGASPSQVLFHELAHAYRYVSGLYNPRPTIGGSTPYTNMEEFFAVVLSNVLIADPTYSSGNRTLRADHAGFVALAPALSTSRGFLSHAPNQNKMRELVASDPSLCDALKGVKSYFNPFAEPM